MSTTAPAHITPLPDVGDLPDAIRRKVMLLPKDTWTEADWQDTLFAQRIISRNVAIRHGLLALQPCTMLPRREETGLLDINGRMICDGDVVLIFNQEYEGAAAIDLYSSENYGEIPIVEIDESRPKPVSDVPLARGIVAWDARLLAYVVRFVWACPQWDRGLAGCHLGGGAYAYEVVGNEKAEPRH